MDETRTNATIESDRAAADGASDDPARNLDRAIARSRDALLELQDETGFWSFELEADCTIPAEYVIMQHFMGDVADDLAAKIGVYVRERQNADGSWPLFARGAGNISCSVKCYWALKLAGDDPALPHMLQARDWILAQGGAAKANVFTRYTLWLFGEIPTRAVPFLPVELVLLPRWFPFHLSKVSYWSRTVMVPLAILYSLRPRARNPRGVTLPELFVNPPEEERGYFRFGSFRGLMLLALARTVRVFERWIPRWVRRRALARAEGWFVKRLNDLDGLGSIFPAMVNAHEALRALGYADDDPLQVKARESLEGLVVDQQERAYVQPCLSPIWDTALACLALQEVEATGERSTELADARRRSLDWLATRQILDGPADWRDQRPDLEPGGWAFQFNNAHYPDLDDTAVVAWAMAVEDPKRFDMPIRRATTWLEGMQSSNGGFGAFDVDNAHYYLNDIPFADHGALLDPPTADVSARCLTLLGLLGRSDGHPASRCLDYIFAEQEANGSWFGRWGTNYIYGTWSVLMALEQVDDARKPAAVTRAVEWLESVQRDDGSWGEGNDTYFFPDKAGQATTGTAFQTAWALLGLLAAGVGDSPAVRRGVDYLLRVQREHGLWKGESFTAPGFPRVFYLKYHGYTAYFPLWALARYRRTLGA